MANSVGTAYLTLVPKLGTAGITTATREFERFGKDSGSKAGDGFMSQLKAAVNIAAIAVIGKQVADALSAPLMAYADYEQLVGGVETLFKGSSDAVIQYANEAYKTAGLSANQYMETVTSFSASLLQSLDGDTQKAAQAADVAITDMADNANKMGTSMESIQNAYQGFAKQNYTMLDNLKLGYGGTKSEMERLLADATALTGVQYDISNLSDVYEAIHVIQTELGITGTTAIEAASTISGSMASASAAWKNFLTGMANGNADMEVLLDELIQSVITMASNIVPAVVQIVQNVADMLAENLPTIIDNILAWVNDNLPTIITAGITLLGKLVEGIPALLVSLGTHLPEIIATIITTLISPSNLSSMRQIGVDLLNGFIQGINSMLGSIVQAVRNIASSLITAAKNALGIHSPSRVFRSLGEYTMEGYADGIDAGAIEAQRAVDRAMKSVLATGANGVVGVAYGNNNGGNITIQNLSVNAEDATSAEQFVSMLRRASVAYA